MTTSRWRSQHFSHCQRNQWWAFCLRRVETDHFSQRHDWYTAVVDTPGHSHNNTPGQSQKHTRTHHSNTPGHTWTITETHLDTIIATVQQCSCCYWHYKVVSGNMPQEKTLETVAIDDALSLKPAQCDGIVNLVILGSKNTNNGTGHTSE